MVTSRFSLTPTQLYGLTFLLTLARNEKATFSGPSGEGMSSGAVRQHVVQGPMAGLSQSLQRTALELPVDSATVPAWAQGSKTYVVW